jgi:hypothetical protein
MISAVHVAPTELSRVQHRKPFTVSHTCGQGGRRRALAAPAKAGQVEGGGTGMRRWWAGIMATSAGRKKGEPLILGECPR